MLRDFQALSERPGAPGRLGRKLHAALGEAFEITNRPGRDPTDLDELRTDLAPTQQRLRSLLEHGARDRCQQTRRFAGGLLALWPALWAFTRLAGVTPTNNGAPVVLGVKFIAGGRL